MSKLREHLEDANRHLQAAVDHHDAGNHYAARYRVGKAKAAVEDALGAELSSPDAAVNPTETSEGRSARRRAARGMIRGTAAIHVEGGAGADITKVIASTNQIARDGWVVEPSGLKTANFLRTAAILFNHNYEAPVATPAGARLLDGGAALEVDIQWPPAGVSPRADEVRGLVKSGVIRAVSIGFMPLEMEPLDPKEPWGGQRVLSADLLEVSFVGVPADTGAVITQRGSRDGNAGRYSKQSLAQRLAAISDSSEPKPAGLLTGPERAQHYREQERARLMAFYGIRRRD